MRNFGLRTCLAIVFFSLGLFAVGKIQAAPRMEIDQPVWNFGIVTNLILLTHDFVIRNSGDEPLLISHVISSCNACLLARINLTNIPPGGTTVVHSYLDLRRLSGPETRMIMLDSNDPKMPSNELELDVVVVPCYFIQPMQIDLDLSQGQKSAVAEVAPLIQLRAPLSKISCTDSNITARIEQRSANQYLLVLEALKTTPHGDAAYGVTICSSDSNDPSCWLICHIHNPPDLELIPPQLKLQPQDEPQMRILWIKQHGAVPLTLLDAIPSTDKYHCEIDPDPDGFDYRIYVTAWEQQPFAGKTNALTLKMVDSLNHDQSVTIPMFVEQQ
jgi:hypothetical protein